MRPANTESGFTIPSDWDGETWCCVEIQWPASEQWDRLLRSLLYHLTRGRTWDKYTGQITDVQTVAWDIYNRNQPFVSCGDGGNGDESGAGGNAISGRAIGGGALIVEDDDMGQVVTDIQVVDGKIRVFFGPCCYHDLAGFTVSVRTPDVGDNPLDPTGSGEIAYYACGKANAVVDLVWLVVLGCHEALSGDFEFWNWISTVEDYVGYNLKDNYVTVLIAAFRSLGAVWSPTEVWTVAERDQAKCALAAYFDDDSIGVPDDAAFYAIKAIMQSSSGSFFPDQGYVGLAIDSIGRSLFDTVAKLGAGDSEAVCPCIGEIDPNETDPDASGWYLGAPLDMTLYKNEPFTSQCLYVIDTPVHDTYGYFLVLRSSNENYVKRMSNTAAGFNTLFAGVDVSANENTSDHLENANQTLPFIQLNSDPLVLALAQSRDYVSGIKLAGGVDGTTIESPECPAGNSIACRIDADNDVTVLEAVEFRWVHNVNSPSHSA